MPKTAKSTSDLEPESENHSSKRPNQAKKYPKRIGTSGISGQLNETKLLMLILLRALNDKRIANFYLGTNVDKIGAFDDIIFRYNFDGQKKPKILFIQAKHRDDPDKGKVTVEKLFAEKDSDFSLHKYLDSYLRIKQNFHRNNDDPIFEGDFEDIDCDFIIHTPAKEDLKANKKVALQTSEDDLIYTSNTGMTFQFKYEDIHIDRLAKTSAKSRMEQLAESFAKFILSDNDKNYTKMMSDELIKRYHVFLAQNVVKVSKLEGADYLQGQFLPEFLNSQDDRLSIFREAFDRKANLAVNDLSFKLPITFGNLDFKVRGNNLKRKARLDHITSKLIELIKNSDNNIVKIDDSIVGPEKGKLLTEGDIGIIGGLGGLVGNLLILDEGTEMLKFNTEKRKLPETAKKLFKMLESRILSDPNSANKNITEYRFEINVKGFPEFSLINQKEVIEFLDKVKFYTNQAKEDGVEAILKQEISKFYPQIRESNFDIKNEAIFLGIHDELQKWWKLPKEADYLTESCDFFDRVSEKIIDNPILNILRIIYFNQISVNGCGIEFNSNSIEELGLGDFLRDPNKQILNVITKNNVLSAVKLIQHFGTKADYMDLDYLCSSSNDYLEKAIAELKQKIGDSNVVIIQCKDFHSDVETLYKKLHSIMIGKPKSHIILIAQENDPLAIKFRDDPSTNSKFVEKKDDKNCFTDITVESQDKLLNQKKTVFQGDYLSVKNLLGFDENAPIPQTVLDKLNFGSRELETFLSNKNIVIWNNSLQLSNLRSAHYKTHARISSDQLKLAIGASNQEDRFIFVGEENKIKQLIPENEKLSKFEGTDSSRFILLETDRGEEQFKQLCQLVDKANVEKEAGIQPVLYLLKYDGGGWVWNQTYTRNFYTERSFYPAVLNKDEIKELLVESKQNSTDFIVFSGVQEEDLVEFLGLNDSRDYRRNSVVLLDETAAQMKFKRLSESANRKKSIHWVKVVEAESKKQLQWHDSCGAVYRLRFNKLNENAIDNPISELSLVDNRQRIAILADEPGMGKSTTLARIGEFIEKEKPQSWIMKIDLNHHQQVLSSKSVKTKEEIVDLLFKIDPNPTSKENSLAKKILAYQLECPGQVVLLFDEFDEVKPEKQENVLALFEFLQKETAAMIWITTRTNDQVKLEDRLSVLAYKFEPLDEAKQIYFLTRFWTTTLKLPGTGINPDPFILKDYAKEVIQRFERSIQAYEEDKNFISIPLRARMLAEIFREEVGKALGVNKASSELFKEDESLAITDLYQRFIDQKFDIYLRDKVMVDGVLDKDAQALLIVNYMEAYKSLAMKVLFDQVKTALSIGNKKVEITLNTLSRIGLILGNEEPVNFIHRTFAEYFAAKWLAEHKDNRVVQDFLSIQLFRKESKVVRRFFDNFLTEGLPAYTAVLRGDLLAFEELLNGGFDISETDDLGRTVLHLAAQEGREEVIQYLWRADKKAVDQFRKTPLHYAASFGHHELMDQLLRSLVDIDLDDHILRTPLHYGTEIGEGSIFNNVEYTKSNLVKLVNKEDLSGYPALYYAADNQHWDSVCHLLLHGADSRIMTKEWKKELLLFAANKTHDASYRHHLLRPIVGLFSLQVPEAVKDFSDNYEYPRLLSYFFTNGHTKVIDALLGSIEDLERRKRIANHGDNNIKPLDRFIPNDDFKDADYLKILKYLLNQGVQYGIEIGETDKGIALLTAASNGHLNTFKYLVEELKVPVSHCEDDNITVIDRALMENRQLGILKYLWENHRESINDSSNLTPLHIAAWSADLQAVHYLCIHGANIQAKDQRGRTPLHYAAQAPRVHVGTFMTAKAVGHMRVVKYLIEERGAELNIADTAGKTALDLASENEQWEITDYLLSKSVESPRHSGIRGFFESLFKKTEILHPPIRYNSKKYLLYKQVDINSKNEDGKTHLHCAAESDWPDKSRMVEWLLQRGAQYDVLQNDQKTALDILRENPRFAYQCRWLLKIVDDLFHSRHLMQDLQEKLLRDKDDIKKMGPYGTWFPDVYDSSNPMQFILNARSIKKGSLFHVASDTGDLEALKCLLKFNQDYIQLNLDSQFVHAKNYQAIDINVRDEHENTPLHLAAKHGHQEILVLLLEEGAMFNAKNSEECTPKVLAQNRKHQEVVKVLEQIEDWFEEVKENEQLEYPKDSQTKIYVHAKDRDGKTLIHWAAQKGRIGTVQMLLDYLDYVVAIDSLKQTNKTNIINALDNQDRTPLHESVINDHIEIIRLLLQRGARFDIKDSQGKTPLDYLAQNTEESLLRTVNQSFDDIQTNRPDKVIQMLQHLDNSTEDLSAILHARDEENYTLLHWAARERYYDVLRELLKRGAVYDSKDRSFKTNDWFKLIREWMFDEKPLKFSVEEVTKDPNKLTIIKKARDYSGKTPLHTNENYFRVKYLIGQEVDFTLPDHEGDTPLHAAVKRGDMDIAKLFLDRGANVNAKNKNNSTPLHMAALSGHFHVTQLLLDYKSDFNTVDKKGRTPLDLAKEKFSQDPENHNLKKITDLIFRVVK